MGRTKPRHVWSPVLSICQLPLLHINNRSNVPSFVKQTITNRLMSASVILRKGRTIYNQWLQYSERHPQIDEKSAARTFWEKQEITNEPADTGDWLSHLYGCFVFCCQTLHRLWFAHFSPFKILQHSWEYLHGSCYLSLSSIVSCYYGSGAL